MVAQAGYTARDVAKLLDVSIDDVRAFVRDGLVEAERGPKREYRFRFQDLVLLRVARDLTKAQVPKTRIRRALAQLKDEMPNDRRLSELQIAAEEHRVVVHDGKKRWDPESGQMHFRFEVKDLARRAAPLARQRAKEAAKRGLTAEQLYDMACELEVPSPRDAREAYERVLDIDPDHIDARINLGRLLHEAGELDEAETHYRRALETDPKDATAAFNLGVVLEDMRQPKEALEAYERAVEADPTHTDALFNAAGVCERLGRRTDAVRYLKSYKELTR